MRSQRPRGREIRNIYGNGAILAKRQLVIDLDWCHPQPSSEERRDEGSTDLNANTANAQPLSRAVARSSKSAGNIDRTQIQVISKNRTTTNRRHAQINVDRTIFQRRNSPNHRQRARVRTPPSTETERKRETTRTGATHGHRVKSAVTKARPI